MIVIRVFRVLDHFSATLDWEKPGGPWPNRHHREGLDHLGYVTGETAGDGDSSDEVLLLLTRLVEKSERAAAERGGWGLLI